MLKPQTTRVAAPTRLLRLRRYFMTFQFKTGNLSQTYFSKVVSTLLEILEDSRSETPLDVALR